MMASVGSRETDTYISSSQWSNSARTMLTAELTVFSSFINPFFLNIKKNSNVLILEYYRKIKLLKTGIVVSIQTLIYRSFL